jgi:hypothetical protein
MWTFDAQDFASTFIDEVNALLFRDDFTVYRPCCPALVNGADSCSP